MSRLLLNFHKYGIIIGILLFSCTAWGINQSEQNNVFGVIQLGPFAAVDIIQKGDYNRTAVVQFGIDPVGTITQQGNYNRAVVFQISDTSTLNIFQDGVFNITSISQDSSSPVGSLSQSSLNTLVNNFLFAPETLASQTELTQIKTLSFNTSLLARLDHPLSKRFTVFGGRNLAEGQHSDRLGAIGFDYNITTSMIGGEMQLTPNMRLGLALQRSKTDGDVNYGLANIDIHSTQFSIFGSVNIEQLFMDFAAGYGNNDYKINRPGFASPVSSSHEGYDVSLSTRAGYLFKHNSLKFGPVVGLNYIQTNIDSYQELGNVLLTQIVDEQLNEFLIGEVGVQLRYKSHNFSTFTNLTLEHDFTIEEFRVIDSSYSMSPDKKVFIPVSDFKHNNSVRLLSGLDVEIDFGLELSFLVDFRFNNDDTDAWMVGANVNYPF